jgi:ribosomal-protein-alanine N-acetyltransferase
MNNGSQQIEKMQLQTPRLLLSELTLADLADVHLLHTSPEVDEYNTLGIPENIGVTRMLVLEWLEQQNAQPRQNYIFSLKLESSQEFIGLIALKPGKPNYKNAEVWYKLLPAHWRQGYALEALKEVLKFAFGPLGLHRVEAGCAVDNTGSIKLLERVGMKPEGRKRQVLPIRGQWADNYIYAILESDFKAGA